MEAAVSKLWIELVGRFRLYAPDGSDVTPRPMASALLALLALSPGQQRSREYIQDKLWSTRSPEQGRTSLRNALADIRAALGEDLRECLRSDQQTIALDPQRVTLDWGCAHLQSPTGSAADLSSNAPVLLEDMGRIRDPEFQNWLRDVRMDFERKLFDAALPVVTPKHPEPSRVPTTAMRPWLVVSADVLGADPDHVAAASLAAELLQDAIGLSVTQFGAIDIVDCPRPGPGVIVAMKLHANSTRHQLYVRVRSSARPAPSLSIACELPAKTSAVLKSPAFLDVVSRSADVALHEIGQLHTGDNSGAHQAAFDALHHMQRFGRDNLVLADDRLAVAYETEPRPLYLAMQAFVRAFLIGERIPHDPEVLREEAREQLGDAMRAEPHNAAVLALASHVHNFLFRDPAAGHEFARRSLAVSPANTLAMSCLGRAEIQKGNSRVGFRLVRRATAGSGPSAYRFLLEFNHSIGAISVRKFDEAIRIAEVLHAEFPRFPPVMRNLFALYLKNDNRERARRIFAELRQIEPDFSVRAMREASYPARGLRAAGVLPEMESEFD
jgi:DNA-binding SARP family transcriptional activator